MTVSKRGRYYHYEFMVAGNRYRGVLHTAKDKAEARMKEAELRRQVYDGTYGLEEKSDDFATYVDEVFMTYSKENKKSTEHDRFRCEMLKTYFAGKSLRQIAPMFVEKFIKDRLNSTTQRVDIVDGKKIPRKRAATTVHKELKLLSQIFTMAIRDKVATENPCDHIGQSVRKKIRARNKRERYLNQVAPDEEQRLFEKLSGKREHLVAIVKFDLETGLRKSELLKLKCGHVNLTAFPNWFTIDDRQIKIMPGELLVERSKNGKPRTVPMSEAAKKIARERLADVTTGEYLFTNPKTKTAYGDVKTAFAGAVREADIGDFTFHDLRHTFATRLKEVGVGAETRRDLLGHSTVEMTADYTHTSPEAKRRAIDGLNTVSEPIPANLLQAAEKVG